MSESSTSAASTRRRIARRATVLSAGAVALVAGGLVAGGLVALPAQATDHPAPAPGVETVVALDPALTAGRGANVAFVEQEAENATTNGDIIGPGRNAYTLEGEASGRRAVKLDAPGEYVDFTLTRDANAITVRYALPDAPSGGGIAGELAVSVNGKKARRLPVTSQYSWLYSTYPFSNDPNATPPDDWWIPESRPVTTPFRPFHFYAEQRLLLGKRARQGDVVRVALPAGSTLPYAVIDLADFESVPAPGKAPWRSLPVTWFGADPTGKRESADAFERTINVARLLHWPVYLPAGTYRVSRHIIVDDVTVLGAGSWYSIVTGHGVGFYGKYVEDGGSRNVHLSGFAIIGDVRERIDTDQVNGVGGALSDSTIDGLYIQRTKVGMWFDGPMDNLAVTNNIIVDQIADGLNFHTGVTNSVARHNFVRNTGDDGLAMWSEHTSNANNTFDHNTVQTPTLANGIAIYGGHDNTVSNNLIADPIREGSGIQVGSRFGAEPFTGHLWITDNTTVRAGTFELNWNIGLGAIWIYALERSIDANIQVVGDHFLDNGYNAIMLVSEWSVKDLYTITNVHFKDIRVDGTGTSVLSARVAGSASFENVDARNVGAVGVNNCGSFHFTPAGSEFTVIDLGGNDGGGTTGPWLAPWELPNTITCDDRPPVVVPAPPAAW